MARGIERGLIFRDDHDKDDFIGRLSVLASKQAWIIYAWSLMSNHFHLLVRTGNRPLSRNMRVIMSGYAGYFNRRHHRQGHVFQNRYKSIVCEEETYFLELVRYLHLNPIRAKLVKDLTALDSYKYSGHAAIMGKSKQDWQDIDEVLGRFSESRRAGRRLYRDFMEAGIGQGRRPELVGGGLLRSHGGWQGVLELRRGREKYLSDDRVLGSTAFIEEIVKEAEEREEEKRSPVSLETLAERICRDMQVSRESIAGGGRNRNITKARAVLAYVWVRHLGRSGHELARTLGVTPQAVYAASSRIETIGAINSHDVDRWCRQ